MEAITFAFRVRECFLPLVRKFGPPMPSVTDAEIAALRTPEATPFSIATRLFERAIAAAPDPGTDRGIPAIVTMAPWTCESNSGAGRRRLITTTLSELACTLSAWDDPEAMAWQSRLMALADEAWDGATRPRGKGYPAASGAGPSMAPAWPTNVRSSALSPRAGSSRPRGVSSR
jgi:hypothetical protein